MARPSMGVKYAGPAEEAGSTRRILERTAEGAPYRLEVIDFHTSVRQSGLSNARTLRS